MGEATVKCRQYFKLKLTCIEDHDQSSSRNEKVYPGNIHCAFAQRIITQSELLRGTNVFFFCSKLDFIRLNMNCVNRFA